LRKGIDKELKAIYTESRRNFMVSIQGRDGCLPGRGVFSEPSFTNRGAFFTKNSEKLLVFCKDGHNLNWR
jgi:hypothetical protein